MKNIVCVFIVAASLFVEILPFDNEDARLADHFALSTVYEKVSSNNDYSIDSYIAMTPVKNFSIGCELYYTVSTNNTIASDDPYDTSTAYIFFTGKYGFSNGRYAIKASVSNDIYSAIFFCNTQYKALSIFANAGLGFANETNTELLFPASLKVDYSLSSVFSLYSTLAHNYSPTSVSVSKTAYLSFDTGLMLHTEWYAVYSALSYCIPYNNEKTENTFLFKIGLGIKI